MNFRERFKFYLIGLIAGTFVVFLIFGRRSSCKDMVNSYSPTGRVLMEMRHMPVFYSNEVMNQLSAVQMDTSVFRTKIIPELDFNFDLSNPREKPCAQYVAYYTDSTYHWKIDLQKCKEMVEIKNIEDYDGLK